MIAPISNSMRWPTTSAMVDLWNGNPTGRTLRFALWALKRAYARGCYVLS